MKGTNKLVWHQVVLVGLVVVLSGLRLLTKQWAFGTGLLWWWLGAVLGFLFVFMDRFIYLLVTNVNEVHSVKVKELLGRGKLLQGLVLTLSERDKQQHLMIRSALFVAIYLVLAFWAATSVANPLSRGFILGLGTHLFFDLVWDYTGKGRAISEWFWQIKRALPVGEIKFFVWTTTGLFVLLALFI